MPRLRPSLALVLGLAGFLLRAAAEQPPVALIQGALPNGVRYAILPRAAEPGRVSLRLIVHAGSLDEHDDERGYAHFVEHMAFNGTRHYPPGKLVQFFQRLGLALGPDLGADTSFTRTIYKLDLPAGHGAELGEALQVLRDYADGVEFASAEVRREKGVVLSELAARDTDDWRRTTQGIAALFAGTSLPDRFPIGDTAQIERASADGLRAFYRRCYRPERMTLLVVGDIAADAAVRLIGGNFATMHADGPGAAPIDPSTLLDVGGLHADTIVSAGVTSAIVDFIAVVPRGPNTLAAREAEFAESVVARIFSRRLRARRAQAAERFGSAGAQWGFEVDGRFIQTKLEAQASVHDWPAAVALVENELRRARETGFTADELAEASDSLLATLRTARDAEAGATPDVLASRITEALVSGHDWRGAAGELAAVEAYLPRLTPAVAAEALRTMLPDARLHVVLTLPRPVDGGPDAVLAAYRESAARPLAEPPADAGPLQFRYVDFGPPGTVATHRTESDLHVELIEFANGVRLNLRPSGTEPHRFSLIARLGRGFADQPRDRPGLTMLAGTLLGESDLGRHPREELGRLLRVRAVSADTKFDNNQFTVALAGPAAELPFAFQFLAACLSDWKLEASHLPRALSLYGAVAGNLLGSSSNYAKVETLFRLAGNDPRFQIPPLGAVAKYPFSEIVAWTKSRWLDGPVEIGVVGDFDPATAVNAAAASVGTLPRRHESASTPEERLTLLAKPYRTVARHPLPDQTATVRFAWLARDAGDNRVSCALQLATDGLVDRLRTKLREDLGVTYSPSGGVFREPLQRDFAFASVALTFAPDKARDLSDRVLRIADELARRGLTREEFTRLREPLLARTAENLRTNAWWLNEVLLHAQTQPAVLDDARMLATTYSTLTRDEVNRAAASHFRIANANVIGVAPAAPAPGVAPSASKK